MTNTNIGWQPIETTPRDRTRIAIGWYAQGKWCEVVNCRFAQERRALSFTDDRYHGVYDSCGSHDHDEKNYYTQATHWRVQIAPPEYVPVSDDVVEKLAASDFEYKQIGNPDLDKMPWGKLNRGHQDLLREQVAGKVRRHALYARTTLQRRKMDGAETGRKEGGVTNDSLIPHPMPAAEFIAICKRLWRRTWQSALARDLVREPRTIRRWKSGESPVPKKVAEYLTNKHNHWSSRKHQHVK